MAFSACGLYKNTMSYDSLYKEAGFCLLFIEKGMNNTRDTERQTIIISRGFGALCAAQHD